MEVSGASGVPGEACLVQQRRAAPGLACLARQKKTVQDLACLAHQMKAAQDSACLARQMKAVQDLAYLARQRLAVQGWALALGFQSQQRNRLEVKVASAAWVCFDFDEIEVEGGEGGDDETGQHGGGRGQDT